MSISIYTHNTMLNLHQGDEIIYDMCRFWETVQELKTLPQKDVQMKVEEIWREFLDTDASCPINVDSRSYEITKKSLEKPDRWCFDVAAV